VAGRDWTTRCVHRKPAHAGISLFLFSQQSLLREYRHLAVFCVQFGGTFVDAVANMEKRLGNAFSLTLLRELRGLATPETREKILPVMASDYVSAKVFRKAVENTLEDMWVDWHWSMAPDTLIHPTKRMPFHPLVC
jgi:hypothetical protein